MKEKFRNHINKNIGAYLGLALGFTAAVMIPPHKPYTPEPIVQIEEPEEDSDLVRLLKRCSPVDLVLYIPYEHYDHKKQVPDNY